MRDKVLLITPPYHSGVLESAGRWPNLAFIYMAGELRKAGFDVEIYDAMTLNHSASDIARRIEEVRPFCVATTAFTAAIYAALDVLGAAKAVDPHIVTVVGGVHVHFCYEEIMRAPGCPVDYIVRGEGERTLPELLTALRCGDRPSKVRGIVYREDDRPIVTAAQSPVHDLDSLTPAWDLVDWSEYTLYPLPGSRMAMVGSSRGCLHGCAFCSQQLFWGRSWRARDPERFVDELEYLRREHDIDVAMLSDEYPTPDRHRWERILDLLIERDLGMQLGLETRVHDIVRDADIMDKYRRAGILHIYVGVESTSQETLDLFKKNIKCEQSQQAIRLINEAGIISECAFVLGMPHETAESVEQTFQLAKRYAADMPHFLLIAPWPYADMYEELRPYIVTHDYSRYNFVEPVVKPPAMSTADLQRSVVDSYRRYYSERLPDIFALPDGAKRDYMLLSIQAMMKNSFLARHMSDLGSMPAKVEALLHKRFTSMVSTR